MRRESLFALGAIGPASAKVTDKIVAKLADEDQEVRHAACYALGKIGPEARAALPKLRSGHGQRRRVPAIGGRVGVVEDFSQGRGTQAESRAVSR